MQHPLDLNLKKKIIYHQQPFLQIQMFFILNFRIVNHDFLMVIKTFLKYNHIFFPYEINIFLLMKIIKILIILIPYFLYILQQENNFIYLLKQFQD